MQLSRLRMRYWVQAGNSTSQGRICVSYGM